MSYNKNKILDLDITVDDIFGDSSIFTNNGIIIIKLFMDNDYKYINSISGIAKELDIVNNTVKRYVNMFKKLGILNEVYIQDNMRTFMLNNNSDIIHLFHKIRKIELMG